VTQGRVASCRTSFIMTARRVNNPHVNAEGEVSSMNWRAFAKVGLSLSCGSGPGGLRRWGRHHLPPVSSLPQSRSSVVTYHNDKARTDQNVKETILTTTNVSSGTFGKINSLSADCKVDAQLYLSNIQNVGGEPLMCFTWPLSMVFCVDARRRACRLRHLGLFSTISRGSATHAHAQWNRPRTAFVNFADG
jgi:hypothetical protein